MTITRYISKAEAWASKNALGLACLAGGAATVGASITAYYTTTLSPLNRDCLIIGGVALGAVGWCNSASRSKWEIRAAWLTICATILAMLINGGFFTLLVQLSATMYRGDKLLVVAIIVWATALSIIFCLKEGEQPRKLLAALIWLWMIGCEIYFFIGLSYADLGPQAEYLDPQGRAYVAFDLSNSWVSTTAFFNGVFLLYGACIYVGDYLKRKGKFGPPVQPAWITPPSTTLAHSRWADSAYFNETGSVTED